MKYFFLFFALTIFAAAAFSQTNWVVCKSTISGETAVFQDRCPSGWYFVRYA